MFNFAVHPTKVGQTMIGEDISLRHAGIALCVLHEPQRRWNRKISILCILCILHLPKNLTNRREGVENRKIALSTFTTHTTLTKVQKRKESMKNHTFCITPTEVKSLIEENCIV